MAVPPFHAELLAGARESIQVAVAEAKMILVVDEFEVCWEDQRAGGRASIPPSYARFERAAARLAEEHGVSREEGWEALRIAAMRTVQGAHMLKRAGLDREALREGQDAALAKGAMAELEAFGDELHQASAEQAE